MIFCEICKKSFPRKYNYERHLMRNDHILAKDDNLKSPSLFIVEKQNPKIEKDDIKPKVLESYSFEKNEFGTKDTRMKQTSIKNHKETTKKTSFVMTSPELKPISVENIQDEKIKNDLNGIQEEGDFLCNICGNYYSNRSNLNRHIKKCQLNKKGDKTNEEFYQEQIVLMQNQINTLINKMGSAPTYVQNISQKIENTVNQQNIQQININAYGKENMDYITLNDMQQIIKQPKACLPKFIELLHYDENHPENHNVILESIKNNMIKILQDNNRWAYQVFEKFVEQFTLEKYDQLYDLLLDYDSKTNIDEILKDKFEKWADRFDYEDSNTRKKAEEDVKLALISGGTWLKSKGKKRPTKRAIMKMLEKENMSISNKADKIKSIMDDYGDDDENDVLI